VRNLSIKLYRIYVCYPNITLYHVIYSVRYHPLFHVTAVGLGTYYRGYGSPSVCIYYIFLPTHYWTIYIYTYIV